MATCYGPLVAYRAICMQLTTKWSGDIDVQKNPEQHSFYAIDKFWFHLQKKDNWFLIIPLTVTQKEDYSDIEKRYTNYTKSMLDLDKKNYIITNTNSFQREKYVPKLSFL